MSGSAILAQVSSQTQAWQSLFDLYLALALAAGAITVGSLLFFAFRYRTRGEERRAPLQSAKASPKVIVSVIILMVLALSSAAYATFGTMNLYATVPDSSNAIRIQVTGFQWAWAFVYPDGRQVIGELRVPVNAVIILNVTSRDVFHSFGIPSLDIKADAIPGRFNPAWFTAQELGTYTIRCYELCGVGHAFMIAKLTVMDEASYSQWYNTRSG